MGNVLDVIAPPDLDDEIDNDHGSATCAPCEDGEHATVEDGRCTCCGEFVVDDADECTWCNRPARFCNCDDAYEAMKDRELGL